MKNKELEDLKRVYLFADGESYDEPPSWKSDDFDIRFTSICEECEEELEVEYCKPFASCACGTREWYK